MIDTLLQHKAMAEKLTTGRDMGLEAGEYAVLTLHRPSNVDDKETLNGIFEALISIAEQLPIVFPIHPRTRKMMDSFGLSHYLEPREDGEGLLVPSHWATLSFCT